MTRCDNLINWAYKQYDKQQHLDGDDPHEEISNNPTNRTYNDIATQYGIYTETPDCVPLLGFMDHDINESICYIVGCNAWGQAILSYCATVVPALLKCRPFTENEKKSMELLSIQRFTHHHNNHLSRL